MVRHPDGRTVPIQDGCYPINSAAAASLVMDKPSTYALLGEAGFKPPEGDWFFISSKGRSLRPGGKELEDAVAYAKRRGFPLFVKPDRGSMGYMARIVFDEAALRAHLQAMAGAFGKAIVQRVVDAEEYRVAVLDGEVAYTYRRTIPRLRGDGRHSFDTLLATYRTERAASRFKEHVDESCIDAQLRALRLTRDAILPEGVEIRLSDTANRANGGVIDQFSDEASAECAAWAARVASTLGLRWCAIDLFAPAGLHGNTDGFVLIEVNGSPLLNNLPMQGWRDLGVVIWERILDAAFQDHHARPASVPALARRGSASAPATLARPASGWERLGQLLAEGSEKPDEHDVVVVGAGLSGLMAADVLHDLDVLLLETEQRPGGRVLTREQRHVVYDMGAVFACDFRGLSFTPRDSRIIDESRRVGMYWKGELRVAEDPRALLDELEFTSSERVAVRDFLDKPESNAAELPGAAYQALNALFQLIHPGDIGDYIPARQRDGLVHYDARRYSQGNAVVVDGFHERLGERLRLGADVISVEESDTFVRVCYRHEGREREAFARAVIVATPAPVARRILAKPGADAARFLDSVRYGAGSVVVLGLSEPPAVDAAYVVTPDLPCGTILIQRGEAVATTLIVYYVGEPAVRLNEQAPELIARETLAFARRAGVTPCGDEGLVFFDVRHWPMVGPVISEAAYGAHGGNPPRPSAHVFLAGDYTHVAAADPFPYGMSAALQAGRRAAYEARRRLRDDRRAEAYARSCLATVHVFEVGEDAPRFLEARDEGNVAFYGLLLRSNADPHLKRYLLDQRVDGLWEYQQGFGVTAEDSALVLEGLLESGVDRGLLRDSLSRLVSRFYHPQVGAFLTIDHTGQAAYWRGASTDATAMIGFLILLLAPDDYPEVLEACARYLVERQRTDGAWQGKWFPSSMVTTYYAARFLKSRADINPQTVDRAGDYILSGQRDDGAWSASVIDTATAVLALNALNRNAAAQERGKAWLEAQRQADGWRGEPVLYYWMEPARGGRRFYHCIDKGRVTSAWATLALRTRPAG